VSESNSTKLWGRAWFVFALVCIWRVALIVFTAQPIPAGDAYFYDGAVVHELNNGQYANPSLSLVLPISGNEVFSAYPPLHQAALSVWMRLFGTAVLSAIWFQFALFLVYGLAVLAIFRLLRVDGVWANLASLFFFAITFMDRPDTLAFGLGMWALFSWLKAGTLQQSGVLGNKWHWLGATLAFLTTCTSLHIGALSFLWLGLLSVIGVFTVRRALPLAPVTTAVLALGALVFLVKFHYPLLWAGFQEHVKETPTLAGWSSVDPGGLFKGNALKFVRTAPALLAVAVVALAFVFRNSRQVLVTLKAPSGALFWTGLCITATLVAVSLGLLMQNPVHWAAYLQPLLVGVLPLALYASGFGAGPQRSYRILCYVLAIVAGARALGMSTWGFACAADVTQSKANRIVAEALDRTPAGSAVLVSAAFLYEADRYKSLEAYHADWVAPFRRKRKTADCIIALKPARMVLTQFDYYRGCGTSLPALKSSPDLLDMRITDYAKIRPPDAISSMQRIIQQVSWAPVIVELRWK